MDFENLLEIEYCWRQIFIIHKHSLGSCEAPQQIWAGSVQLFLVYWIQTNRQTDKQKIYIHIVFEPPPDRFGEAKLRIIIRFTSFKTWKYNIVHLRDYYIS